VSYWKTLILGSLSSLLGSGRSLDFFEPPVMVELVHNNDGDIVKDCFLGRIFKGKAVGAYKHGAVRRRLAGD
jgi:hypothetical protein